jgi:hypothetical protein
VLEGRWWGWRVAAAEIVDERNDPDHGCRGQEEHEENDEQIRSSEVEHGGNQW